MSNKQRYRTGDNQVLSGKIKAGVKAEIGDLMYQSPLDKYLYPANKILADGTGIGFVAGTALANFKGAFAGTLMEGATSGTETVDKDCLCGYGAVYEYPLSVTLVADSPAGTGLTAFVDGATLANQKLAVNAALTNAVGTLARFTPAGATTVHVFMHSSVMDTPLA